ncbi:MAG: extracellular solute-binding protein [Candidatus Brocadiia bacterium]
MPVDYSKLKKYPALLLLITVYVLACVVVFINFMRARGGTGETQKVVLRMAHWQLEPGIRNALDWAIEKYAEQHPNVEVRQILIPEEGYFRWVNTQLIGGTAPDMIECGMGPRQLWPKFYARYFVPLNEYVDEPNPYNAGTELEGVPWRQTYFDEMEGGYEENLKSYFRVPLSTFTQRLYYNKDLIGKVWSPAEEGSEFPRTYESFIDLCKRLQDYYARSEKEGVPIGGSQYSFDRLVDAYRTAMTASYMDQLDVDRDGNVSVMEYSTPLYSGTLKMTEPRIKANFELLREISKYSPPGATSLDRDEVAFLFMQGNAAMVPTGSWDYLYLATQAEFPVGVTPERMPLPSKDNPKYGQYVTGPQTEADTRGAFPFGITKTSKHRAQTLDFLQFLSSLEINQELTRRMYWLPVIAGAKPREELKPFEPRIEGYTAAIEFEQVPGTALTYRQELPLYLSGSKDYEEFVDDYMSQYRKDLREGVKDHVRGIAQTMDQQLRLAAARRAAINGASGAAEALTADPVDQYVRILEAFGGQVNSRTHEVSVWVRGAQLYEQQQ